MKTIKTILIAAAALFALVIIGLILFLKTFDLNRYRATILEQASSAVHRKVDIRDMGLALSLKQGVGVTARQLTIQDDPRFQSGDFLRADRIFLRVDIVALITQRKISVSKIEVSSPRLTIIRNKDGSLNAQGLGQSPDSALAGQVLPAADPATQSSDAPPPSTPGPTGTAGAPRTAAAGLPAFTVKSLVLNNGTITYVDKSMNPELTVALSQINVNVENFSLDAPAHFSVHAALFSDKSDMQMEGIIQLDSIKNEITLSHVRAETDLGGIKPEILCASLPMLKETLDTRPLKGKLKLVIDTLTAGSSGLSVLSASADLNDGSVKIKQLAVPFDSLKAAMSITASQISLKEATCAIGKGTVKAKGSIDDYLTKQTYILLADAQNIAVEEVMDRKNQPVTMIGVVSAQMALNGAGLSPDALGTLMGSGVIVVKDGRLEGFNVFQAVLGKVSVIPGLYDKVQGALPERYKNSLTRNETLFKTIELPVTIQEGNVVVQPCVIDADAFMLSGKATAAIDSRYSFEGLFIITEDLSASLAHAVPELEYLVDEKNRITMPLRVDGKGQSNRIAVDLNYIGQKLLTGKGGQELDKLLDKVFGTRKEGDVPQQSAPSGAQDQGQASTGKQMVNDLLNKILKKQQ